MPRAIGFDIYGTLVDPLDMNEHLRPLAGDDADAMSATWRQKQLEYTFRRGLMKKYENFGVCTKQALDFAAESFGVSLSDDERTKLIEEYQNLHAFPDVAPGLEKMKANGHRLAAFSNGVEATARMLFTNAGILAHLDEIVSVDDVGTFKPDPAVYEYLAKRFERSIEETWLVSSNPFDVIGAKAVGMNAAWIKRSGNAVFDPWGFEPDIVASDLEELAGTLGS
ncbi:MAG: haloacid dehalogenase type II [Actinomycetota bacterium]|nr:haloacid dehalogenase type II [Rubrobacter sp.]MDQ3507383.1 haloacid dehalogenase type II [Actinomycetota bacterium]